MIELRADGSIPGPDKFGRIYKIVDQMTGEVGYNYTGDEFEALDARTCKMIEGYDTFKGWATEVLPIEEIKAKIKELIKAPSAFEETKHTKLVSRVKARLADKDVSDGLSPPAAKQLLNDMQEMYLDLMGRRERPPLPGWK